MSSRPKLDTVTTPYDPHKLYKLADYCEVAGCCRDTGLARANNGTIADAKKVAGHWRVPGSTLNAMVTVEQYRASTYKPVKGSLKKRIRAAQYTAAKSITTN